MSTPTRTREESQLPISIPQWLTFEEHRGELFMLAIEPSGKTHIDGGHSTPAGVRKARELFQAIAIIRPPEGTRYMMLKVEAIPEGKTRLNKSAIRALNSLPGRKPTPETPSVSLSGDAK